jgi:alkyldihydroxyacetonephosphate synthase
MRRWNGWGDVSRSAALDEAARTYLGEHVGPGQPPRDAELAQVLAALPGSRLPQSAPFDIDPALRLRCAFGQSFPDWLALRFGRINAVADAVALPRSHEEAVAALAAAARLGAMVIPYGGGTSVVGHLTVPAATAPVINVSLEALDRLLDVDPVSQLARFGAGTPGPQIEAQLAPHGLLLGHFPQSYEQSTLGGWIATRSSGQQSRHYGRIEQLFAGGRLATPRGELRVGGFPASAAGPDLREFVLGSEGRLGLITEATVRVRALPEREDFIAAFFPDWELGLAAARRLAQSEIEVSMVRLSNAVETETQLRLAGHNRAAAWLRRYLQLRGAGARPVMLVIAVTGRNRDVLRLRRDALTVIKRCHGVNTGAPLGRTWAAKRFHGPYLRNSLWDAGYGVDTVETAVNWTQATAAMHAVEAAAHSAFAAENERVLAFTHLSHVYRQGCSIYSTFVFRLAPDFDRNLLRWQRFKTAVSHAILAAGGTISHQHGVGLDHAPFLAAEKGDLGIDLLRSTAAALDPQGMMNPGKLFA